MYKILLPLLLGCQMAAAQGNLTLLIRDEDTQQPVIGATVRVYPGKKTVTSDRQGYVRFAPLAAGTYDLHITYLGDVPEHKTILMPPVGEDTIPVYLEQSPETLSNVVISTTRLNQQLKDVPIHVDVIGPDDIEESTAMSPGNLQELLSELSGTQVQQTSLLSGNVTIRLQGLDGRYTQLLKDGFPMYGGFSGGLSIMEIPPVDLKQVEVVKGAASALYGGDAIAGIINLVSKTPDSVRDAELVFNQTLKGGTDFSGWYSRRNRKTGISLLGELSHQQPEDVDHDGFTDLPRITEFTLSPTFYWYPDTGTTLRLNVNVSHDVRTGGDLQAILHGPDSLHNYVQGNNTDRYYYQMSLVHKTAAGNVMTIKHTLGYFYRAMTGSGEHFTGTQLSSFTEASYVLHGQKNQGVGGLDFSTDQFSPQAGSGNQELGYGFATIGLFLQDDWKLIRQATLETGIRIDHQNQYGSFFLPRAALLWRFSPQFSVRLGTGLGYKVPTIFNALTEENGFNKVYPLSALVVPERSASANLDVNYGGIIGQSLIFSIDQNFYYTRLNHALIPIADSLNQGIIDFTNAPSSVISEGFETNIKCALNNFSLNIGYTFTDAREYYIPGHPQLPLTPLGRLITSLVYEKEKNFQIALEAFYTGHQYLDAGTRTPDFWTFDVMVQKHFGDHFSILVNVENYTDTRQSRFGPLYTGPMTSPVFAEIYAPLSGRVGNISFKYNW